jgi:uncharacterized protein with PIN domain
MPDTVVCVALRLSRCPLCQTTMKVHSNLTNSKQVPSNVHFEENGAEVCMCYSCSSAVKICSEWLRRMT